MSQSGIYYKKERVTGGIRMEYGEDCSRKWIQLDYAHSRNIYGTGIGVAILDTGIFPHEDFTRGGNRIIAFGDFVRGRKVLYDDYGHGTHVAGIIGSNGRMRDGGYVGIAPKANIIALKVLDSRGNGKIKNVLRALDWILYYRERYNLRVINVSVGKSAKNPLQEEKLLIQKIEQVWDAGLVVVVAAGNNGPGEGSVTIPGVSRKVITVGVMDEEDGKQYSGRGPTLSCICKPEIVAPGGKILSCLNEKIGYTKKSGTSMATPMVSGAIALLLEKHPDYTNKEVKMKLYESAIDLGIPKNQQGWGMLNIKRLLSS